MSILPMLCSLSCIFIFLYAFFKKRWERMTAWELSAGILFVIAAIIAAFTSKPGLASIIQQVGTFVAFWPTFVWVWNDPKAEKPLPWFVWSLAYATLLIVCVANFEIEKWEELVYPINCLILHFTVGLLTFRKGNRSEQTR